MKQFEVIVAVGAWIHANWANIIIVLSALYGFLAVIVKTFPTLNEGWLLTLIKILAQVTNRQNNDKAVREGRMLARMADSGQSTP